jgi:hypothetical protein
VLISKKPNTAIIDSKKGEEEKLSARGDLESTPTKNGDE